MASFKQFSNGRISYLRLTFIFISLLVVIFMIKGQWVFPHALIPNLSTRYQNNSSNNYMMVYDRSSLGSDTRNSTDEIPSLCTFPQVNPYDPIVMKIAGMDRTTIHCEGTFMPDLTYMAEGSHLKVNKTQVTKYITSNTFKECRYKNIYRHDTVDNNYTYSEWSEPFYDSIKLPKDVEFIKVECTNNKSEVVSKTFYALIVRREQLNETDVLNLKKRQVMYSPKETLNIIMVAMDGLPRSQFFRGCNKTYSYLMNSLNSFDLTMHSQLGENTFPNFVPLLTGHREEDVFKWWSYENHLDNLGFLWDTFEAAGYWTLYTEDYPEIGGFHFFKKGFRKPFARYNTRPLTLAMASEKDYWKGGYYCSGNQEEVNFLLGYVLRSLDTLQDKPGITITKLTKSTHDDPTNVKNVDEHLLHFYQSLNQSGHLNRSLLVSFSDHGVRWGPLRDSKNGVFESRTPYTILTFPDWFLRKYPEVAANLKVNTRRLTSHFDTYATLLDLLYFKSDSPPPLAPLRHGISLLKKIPWNRTCDDASIPLEYCLCGYKSLEEIDSKSQISKTLLELVTNALNSKTDKKICAVYKLDKVITIIKISLNADNSTGMSTLYKVKLQVSPGDAIFEATVYENTNSTDFKVSDAINRLNLYRGQADCMPIAMYRPFCYCKNLLSN